MTTDAQQKTAPAIAAWLNPDGQALPGKLQAIYDKLSPEVIQVCEQARKGMRDEFVRGLLQVRAALAESGLFKDWCRAAGINYNTANSIIARAEQKARDDADDADDAYDDEQPGDSATHNRLVGTGRGKNPKEKRDKYENRDTRNIVLVYPVDEYDKLVDGLNEVMRATGCTTNSIAVQWLVGEFQAQAAKSASTTTPPAEKVA